MIKIVLPFLLIGKALKPLAKIKKQSWKAMSGAFNSIKSSVDPMKSFGKIMEILSVVMLPLTFLFTILARIILNELMPYIEDLIVVIDEMGDVLNKSQEEGNLYNDYMKVQIERYQLLRTSIENIGIALYTAVDIFSIAFMGTVRSLYGAFRDLIDDVIAYIMSAGGLLDGGGGDDGGRDPYFWEPGGGIYGSTNNNTTNNSTNLNINLSNSVIESKEKLVRDITEAVIVRIG